MRSENGSHMHGAKRGARQVQAPPDGQVAGVTNKEIYKGGLAWGGVRHRSTSSQILKFYRGLIGVQFYVLQWEANSKDRVRGGSLLLLGPAVGSTSGHVLSVTPPTLRLFCYSVYVHKWL